MIKEHNPGTHACEKTERKMTLTQCAREPGRPFQHCLVASAGVPEQRKTLLQGPGGTPLVTDAVKTEKDHECMC